jgi:aspartokinase
MPVTVLHFIPADLAGGDAILEVADSLVAKRQAGEQIVTLVSAMAGVADMLADSIHQGNYRSVYTKLLAAHTSAARRLARDEAGRKVLIQDMTDILDSYSWLGKSLANRSPTPAESDTILMLGERLSSRLLAANLQSRGIQAVTLSLNEVLPSGLSGDQRTAHIQSKLLPLLNAGYVPLIAFSSIAPVSAQDLTALIVAACG